MPHIIIEGPASLEQFYRNFRPIEVREQPMIMKIKEVYLNPERARLLLECLVVEDRTPNNFYMVAAEKEGKISIHLDALTDPEKTDGVKRLIAIVAQTFKTQHPECRYGSHNLTGYIRDENPPL